MATRFDGKVFAFTRLDGSKVQLAGVLGQCARTRSGRQPQKQGAFA